MNYRTIMAAALFAASGLVTPAIAAKPIVAGIVFSQLQYFRSIQNGMQATAKADGGELLMGDDNSSPEKESTLINTYIARGVKAIIISPLSKNGSVAALKRANDAGIKIILYNSPLSANFPVTSVDSSNEALGQSTGTMAAKFIKEQLGGKAQIALLGFKSLLPQQSNARTNGFLSEVEAAGQVKVVAEQDGWTPEKAVSVAANILTAHPHVNIIFAANDGGTIGAVEAVKQAGLRGKVFVFGIDGDSQMVDFMREKNPILIGTTAQLPFKIGEAAYNAAIDAIDGKKVPKTIEVPVVPLSAYNQAGLDTYLKQPK